jgi:3-hydroxyisobutyrate dehydrogenase
MRVGFIGLGLMGNHMATNVQKGGHDLVVHDLRAEAAKPHLAAGAKWADSPKQVAEMSEVVFTSLPAPPDVEAVALGDGGILAGLGRDKAYFDLSTNSPTVVRRIHKLFAERGVHMLDAPVSGGPRGARTRKLAIWVGGEEPVFQRHKAVLDAMGDQATYIGPIGAGSIAKLVHNCAGYAVHTALAEVFAMGVKAGLEPLALWKAVRKGANGRQRLYDRLADSFLQGKYDPPSFALRLAHKDVSLATAVGREHGVPMRLCELTLMEMTEAMNRGWGERDSRVSMLLELERAGVQIQVDEAKVKEALEHDPPALGL